MSKQKQKIEMEALRFFFKHKGEDIPDEVLNALVTWPENTEINRAVKTVIEVVIALEIATAMKKIIKEAVLKPKFPDGGIFYGGGRNSGGEYVINPKKMKPFQWADAHEPKREIEKVWFDEATELDPILFKPKHYLFQNNITGLVKFDKPGEEEPDCESEAWKILHEKEEETYFADQAWKMLCKTLNNVIMAKKVLKKTFRFKAKKKNGLLASVTFVIWTNLPNNLIEENLQAWVKNVKKIDIKDFCKFTEIRTKGICKPD